MIKHVFKFQYIYTVSMETEKDLCQFSYINRHPRNSILTCPLTIESDRHKIHSLSEIIPTN